MVVVLHHNAFFGKGGGQRFKFPEEPFPVGEGLLIRCGKSGNGGVMDIELLAVLDDLFGVFPEKLE